MSRHWYAFDYTASYGEYDRSNCRLINKEKASHYSSLICSEFCMIYVSSGGALQKCTPCTTIIDNLSSNVQPISPGVTYLYKKDS
jgi:hypothetical protein